MARLYQELRDKKIVKRIAELKAMGMDESYIADTINKEYNPGEKATESVIKNIIENFSIRGTEFMKKDQEIADLYKETVNEIIQEVRKNIGSLITGRDYLLKKTNEMQEMDDTKSMVILSREVQNIVKSINDTLRTANSLLERLETQKKEIVVNSAQTTQQIVKALKDYEKLGMIKINPEFAKSPLFTYSEGVKEGKKEVKEEKDVSTDRSEEKTTG